MLDLWSLLRYNRLIHQPPFLFVDSALWPKPTSPINQRPVGGSDSSDMDCGYTAVCGMKRGVLFGILALLVLALAVAAAGWFSWRSELKRLKVPESITEETGLRLPSDSRITATRAHLFSLVDGDNYEWLIQSDTSLLPWAAANMRVETGGWEHIRQMSELGFPEEMPHNAKFGGVWRASQRTSRGREETSYLYLADDGRVAILGTFRP